ncbi:MAG: high-affinity branched-chain amino acid ABC transporter permease LivM [Niveispirillum sp.]|uniref:high-affinity branched-chain amino acid ABC transporter permease LivM n=1 Tax=Niveispirillum sp. TaxID=1917217 RepID=UPI003BA5B2BC
MAHSIQNHLKGSIIAGLLAMVLAVPFIGLYTVSTDQGLVVEQRWPWVFWSGLIVSVGSFLMGLARDLLAARRAAKPKLAAGAKPKRDDALTAKLSKGFAIGITLFAITLPFMPFSDRYIMDVGTTVLIYVLLGMGLNVTVGLAGLLDLGFVAFYAIGAYSFAILSTTLGWGFWVCLPLSGLIAALFGALLSMPILRLRGDYLAIVTLGFGEITRIVILNWQSFTGGPAGISGIPRPSLFGLSFDRRPPEGLTSFHEVTGIAFATEHRLMFLYLIALTLVLAAAWVIKRLRALPIGRAWEALREDEIACRSLGINPVASKVSAYAVGGMLGGFAGCFFAARQGFVSPESFGFIESALILAIVVLGGMGSQIGVVIAALFIVLLPEVGREFADFRMIVFGIAMIAIMVWRPGGLLSQRVPTIRLSSQKGAGA